MFVRHVLLSAVFCAEGLVVVSRSYVFVCPNTDGCVGFFLMQTFYPPVLAIEKVSTEARNLEKVSVPCAQSVSLYSRDVVRSRGFFDRHPGPPISSKQLALHTLVYSAADVGALCNIVTARLPNFDVSHAVSVLARAAALSTSKCVVENSVLGVCELVEIVRQEVGHWDGRLTVTGLCRVIHLSTLALMSWHIYETQYLTMVYARSTLFLFLG